MGAPVQPGLSRLYRDRRSRLTAAAMLGVAPRAGRLLDRIPPASGAIVMSSGIVSIDLYRDHQPVVAAAMFCLAAGAWLLLAVAAGVRLLHEPHRAAREAGSPAALTSVAGSAVLGTAFAVYGYRAAAAALLALTGLAWALLLRPVLRNWTTPTVGVSFVLSVATQGLAVLGATLAVSYRAGWLLIGALALLIAGLACYAFVAARFDLRQLVTGLGDQWVAGGALAISALACGKVVQAAQALGYFTAAHAALIAAAVVLWCLAMVWLLPLVAGEVVRPRLGYDMRRWATVFPLGMYAACSFAIGQATGLAAISEFARVWTWVAFAVTVVVLGGLLRRGWLAARQHQ